MSSQTESSIARFSMMVRTWGDRAADVTILLVRVSLGVMFAQAGWGKLQNLDRTAGFFEGLGIPAPGFHAMLVANVELLGGLLLVVGLLARLVALPLAVTMVVAISIALLPDVEGVLDLIALTETLYLAVLLLIASQGPGKLSLDALILSTRASKQSATPEQRSGTNFS